MKYIFQIEGSLWNGLYCCLNFWGYVHLLCTSTIFNILYIIIEGEHICCFFFEKNINNSKILEEKIRFFSQFPNTLSSWKKKNQQQQTQKTMRGKMFYVCLSVLYKKKGNIHTYMNIYNNKNVKKNLKKMIWNKNFCWFFLLTFALCIYNMSVSYGGFYVVFSGYLFCFVWIYVLLFKIYDKNLH